MRLPPTASAAANPRAPPSAALRRAASHARASEIFRGRPSAARAAHAERAQELALPWRPGLYMSVHRAAERTTRRAPAQGAGPTHGDSLEASCNVPLAAGSPSARAAARASRRRAVANITSPPLAAARRRAAPLRASHASSVLLTVTTTDDRHTRCGQQDQPSSQPISVHEAFLRESERDTRVTAAMDEEHRWAGGWKHGWPP